MAIFTLEALDARSGDALLLHYGEPDALRLVVIDGGFVGTWNDRLKTRLNELRDDALLADGEQLEIDQVVVTHIDRDHISGIARMFRDLRDDHVRGDLSPWKVNRLWHNSYYDVIEATTGTSEVPGTAADRVREGAAGLAEGRELRDHAEVLGLQGNPPFNGLVTTPARVELGDGLVLTILGPTQARLDQLKEEWKADILPDPTDANIAAFVDSSVPNLSSIAMLATKGEKTMLLTGDARGDDTLAALDDTGLTDDDGKIHVDLLKVPHHGSLHTIDPTYYERISADHYVVSADGRHNNPDHDALQVLVDSQGARSYTIHLTNESHTTSFFAADRAANDRHYTVMVRDREKHSILVDLADPF